MFNFGLVAYDMEKSVSHCLSNAILTVNFASETRYSYAAIKGFHMAIIQSYAEALGYILFYNASLQWVSLFTHYE